MPAYSRIVAVLACLWLASCATGPAESTRVADSDESVVSQVPAAAQTLYEQAVAVMAAGDDIDAQLRFADFLLRYPDYPGAHVNLAILQARSGDDLKAEASIQAALELDARYAPALNQLGMLRRRQGRFDEAEDAYLRAVDAQPDYALAYYNLGVLNELYLQRLEAALMHFERYQSLNGGDEQVEKWIADLKRRLESNQRTANVTE
ncbi:MAG: tetratricopeptide repeat protein [Woeseia sp.]